MIPVYLFTCANPEDGIRWHLFQAVLARWMKEPGIDLTVVAPYMVSRNWDGPLPKGVSLLNVGADRRAFFGAAIAEVDRLSDGDWVLAADDVMPLTELPESVTGKTFVAMGMDALRKFTEYAILGAWSVEGHRPVDRAEPYPVVEPGNPMFVRKGAFPESVKGMMSRDFESFTRNVGLKMGNIPWILHNHIGYKLSTSWPDDYASGLTQV